MVKRQRVKIGLHIFEYYTLQFMLDLLCGQLFLCSGSWFFIAYQPYARAPNTYWNYIFTFKFKQSSYLFSLKNSHPCQDLNPGLPRYQADMLPIELSWLGCQHKICFQTVSLKTPLSECYVIHGLDTITKQNILHLCEMWLSLKRKHYF